MQVGINLKTEPIRDKGFAAIPAGSFAEIDYGLPGTGAITHPARMVLIQNFTNGDLFISDELSPVWPDDIKFAIAGRQSIILDCTSNRTDMSGSFCYAEGTRFSVTQLEKPTTGSIYLTVFYAAE
jgi:hypothetical protein